MVFFEDERIAQNFAPLTLTRPCFDLILGTGTMLQRLVRTLGVSQYSMCVRKRLQGVSEQRHTDCTVNPTDVDRDTLFVNGSALISQTVAKQILSRRSPVVATSGTHIIAMMLKRTHAIMVLESRTETGVVKPPRYAFDRKITLPQRTIVRYPWQLIALNPETIAEDLPYAKKGNRSVQPDATILGDEGKLFLEDGVSIEKHVVLDTRRGPIFVGSGSELRSFTRISGPAYVGRRAVLSSAHLGEGCTVMDHSRVGGEVEQSIVSGYSNKQHAGYLGHSYVGEWVNIGAMTADSDLKNTYGSIKVGVGEKVLDTGMIKLGCFLADCCKTSIGTLIYAGKKVGVASHCHGLVVDDVPSFTIYSKSLNGKSFELDISSAIRTQERMMKRRGQRMTTKDKDLLRWVFDATQEERGRAGVLRERFAI